MRKSIKTFILKRITPTRVFIALLIVAIMLLAPAVLSKQEASYNIVEPLGSSILNFDTQDSWAWDEECMVCAVSGPQYCSKANPECCKRWENECEGDPPPPSYLPPSITSSIACDLWGSGGWCRSNARLTVSASDPQGFTVSITGANPAFSCTSSCTTPITAGQGTATYTGVAATSGLYASGSISWAYDPQAPTISSISVGGTLNGSGEWYTSPTTLRAVTSDNSGVTYTQYRINGGEWINGDSATLADGISTVDFLVFDAAGNSSQASQTISVDTTPPAILITSSGSMGSGGWYVSSPIFTAVASDNLSGVASTQYRVNGEAWIDGDSVTLSDGVHTVEFLAYDMAGNSTTVSQVVNVDTIPPDLTHTIAGAIGNSPWYTSDITITASSSDSISGIQATEYSLDGGAWQAGQIITAGDGIHAIDLRARDNAGNQTQYAITVSVDSTPPVASITSHANGAVVAKAVMLSGVSSGGLSGIKSVQLGIDGSPWLEVDNWTETSWGHRWVTGYGMNGMHTIRLRVTDNAGNMAEDSIMLEVENKLPFIFMAATPVPTSTPLPSPTPTSIPTVVPTVTLPKPTAELSVAPSQWSGVQAAATKAPPEQPQRKILDKGVMRSWRLYAIVAGFFGVFGLTFALDRRASAYRKTAEILLGIMKNNSQEEQKRWTF